MELKKNTPLSMCDSHHLVPTGASRIRLAMEFACDRYLLAEAFVFPAIESLHRLGKEDVEAILAPLGGDQSHLLTPDQRYFVEALRDRLVDKTDAQQAVWELVLEPIVVDAAYAQFNDLRKLIEENFPGDKDVMADYAQTILMSSN